MVSNEIRLSGITIKYMEDEIRPEDLIDRIEIIKSFCVGIN